MTGHTLINSLPPRSAMTIGRRDYHRLVPSTTYGLPSRTTEGGGKCTAGLRSIIFVGYVMNMNLMDIGDARTFADRSLS